MTASELGGGRQLVADLTFGDLAQGGVFRRKFLQLLDERTVAALELFHAQGDDVNENIGIFDHLEGVLDVVVSHGRFGLAVSGCGPGARIATAHRVLGES